MVIFARVAIEQGAARIANTGQAIAFVAFVLQKRGLHFRISSFGVTSAGAVFCCFSVARKDCCEFFC
jgi:hypothetical protein